MHFTNTVSLLSVASLAAAIPYWPEHALSSYASSTPTAVTGSTPSSTSSSTPSSTICPVVQEGDYVWRVSSFSARKLNGTDNNAVSFNISATNNGTLNFQCAASTQGNNVLEEGELYDCGENSLISFAFEGIDLTSTRLLLHQRVSDTVTEVGTTTVPYYCRAGGSAPLDYVCSGVSDMYITLAKLPLST
ncbi:hypothetical protein HBI23_012440 [Parastagonospora nodorum]|nr:hypothetical protein HBI79_005770 [Parastagonospora nodorum]KAH5338283.1 hypothetical protein HBI12_015550 [Parastagonospora nodorum]KAH5690876.1 hypothetical protein HBI23_012440 [Parastagonospora nodorum]